MHEFQHAAAGQAPATQDRALDNPDAFIPGDRRRALALGIAMPDRVRGAALFADISGFTPLTEALARDLGPQRGAEELTATLNRVFHALIAELDHFAGHVLYFSGDAITCWIEGDDGMRATACGLAMQEVMSHLREIITPSGAHVHLAMKIGVAVGTARRFVVGDPEIQLIDVLAGRLVDALATAERHAQKGDVVLEQSALESLDANVEIRERRIDEESGCACGVAVRVLRPVQYASAQSFGERLPPEIVRRWVLPAVFERLRSGRGEFLAELRPAFPVFVRFGNVDYDDDPDAIDKLDDFIRQAQRIVASHGGNLLHVTLGDKGAYLYAVFGSPHAHEDDPIRATSAALELRELTRTSAMSDIRIGLGYGRLRSGTFGHAQRQTFTCLGDAANLAARLMSAAPPGKIYASVDARRAAGEGFTWDELAPVALKGKAHLHSVFALAGAKLRTVPAHSTDANAIVGREAELGAMAGALDCALHGQGRLVTVSGEAGIGKSRLIAELARTAGDRACVAVGECQSYAGSASYFVWREIWATLFGLDRGAAEAEQVRQLEARLAAIDPVLASRAPLLAGLLDLPIADNDLTASFDAKLRKTSLEGLLAECMRARARETPLMIVLEDCHRLDPLSRDLVEVLARTLPRLPVLIVLAYRPGAAAAAALRRDTLPNSEEIRLGDLPCEEAIALIRARLMQPGANAEPARTLIELIASRAQGNPLYIEELINYIARRGIDLRDERELTKLELPESLHSLILSRIDGLEEAPRQTLKVASVFGRTFHASKLCGVYPELGGLATIADCLDALAAADLVEQDIDAEATYAFKHVATREVAYESMPFALRSALHERVGRYIEETEGDAVERNLDLLAHHYWHGENREKKREYLGRAGTAAQAAYANAPAIDYFERLEPLLSKGSRLDMLLKLGKVLELVGNWRRAEEVDRDALAIADDLDDGLRRASCQIALAEVVRKEGRYNEALDLLNAAARGFASFGEESGVAKVSHLVGTVWAQRGDYDKALESYNKSLRIREKIGDKAAMASLLSNLGIVAEYKGDYDVSQSFHRRALALREDVGDRWAIGNSMTNLGMIAALRTQYGDAREWFDKAMQLNREVGDLWMVALCHNNLGNAMRGLGDHAAARRHYGDSLRACRDYDDRWALAFLLEDIGVLAALCGDAPSALELIGATDAIRDTIGAPRAPSLEQEMERQIAPAAAGLSDADRLGCRARGRLLDLAGAIERAFVVCAKL